MIILIFFILIFDYHYILSRYSRSLHSISKGYLTSLTIAFSLFPTAAHVLSIRYHRQKGPFEHSRCPIGFSCEAITYICSFLSSTIFSSDLWLFRSMLHRMALHLMQNPVNYTGQILLHNTFPTHQAGDLMSPNHCQNDPIYLKRVYPLCNKTSLHHNLQLLRAWPSESD